MYSGNAVNQGTVHVGTPRYLSWRYIGHQQTVASLCRQEEARHALQ